MPKGGKLYPEHNKLLKEAEKMEEQEIKFRKTASKFELELNKICRRKVRRDIEKMTPEQVKKFKSLKEYKELMKNLDISEKNCKEELK